MKLNKKLSELEETLQISSKEVENKNIAIKDLKVKLNIALKEKIGELSEYRSEFFGKLKEILKDQKKINIVGDRFVLQSEILFKSGSANIGVEGEKKLSEITYLLKTITKKIQSKKEWNNQIEGHQDKEPISNAEFTSNRE